MNSLLVIIYILFAIQFTANFIVVIKLLATGKLKYINGSNVVLLISLFFLPFLLGTLVSSETDILEQLVSNAKAKFNKLDLYNFAKKKYSVSVVDKLGNVIELSEDQQNTVNTAVVVALGK